jgi:hypothetical protein
VEPNAWTTGRRPGLPGRALMLYAVDVPPNEVAQFSAWYDHEHLPERVAVPGFLRGRRYARTSGPGQRHLTLYDAVDTSVFSSPGYLARLESPTPLTRSVVATFDRPHRAVLRVLFSVGAAVGARLAVVQLPSVDSSLLARWVERELAPPVLSDPDACGLHLAEVDAAATAAKAGTAEGRDAGEDVDDAAVLVIDGTRAIDAMATRVVERCRAAGFADETVEASVYEHVVSLLPPA